MTRPDEMTSDKKKVSTLTNQSFPSRFGLKQGQPDSRETPLAAQTSEISKNMSSKKKKKEKKSSPNELQYPIGLVFREDRRWDIT